MYENEFVGSWYSDKRKFPTIYELLTGKNQASPSRPHHGNVQIFTEEQLTRFDEKDSGRGKLVTKELAILFGYRGTTLDRVDISMLELQFDFRGRSLIWLGATSSEQSLDLLRNLYDKKQQTKFKEEFYPPSVFIVPLDLVVPFLQKILNSNAVEDLRAKAAFWLGNSESSQCVEDLS